MFGTRNGKILAVRQVMIHDTPFWDIAYAFDSAPREVHQGRVGEESIYPDPKPGDVVTIQQVVGVLAKIEKLEE